MARTQTATVVVTDLVGSTALAAQLGHDRYESVRRTHLAALRAVVVDHGGTEVKGTGDGVLLRFDSAADAVRAAREMQRRVHAGRPERAAEDEGATVSPDQVPVAMRIGLAIGEVSFEAGDIFGPAVLEAARVCDATGPGEILCTAPVRWIAAALGDDVFEDADPLTLKGFDAPVPVARVRWTPDVDPTPSCFVVEIEAPGSATTRLLVTTAVDLGRDAEVPIEDTTVSRRHVQLAPASNGLLVTDLGSTNGTFVDGERLTTSVLLGPGDHARIGATTLRVVDGAQLPPAASAGRTTTASSLGTPVGFNRLERSGSVWTITYDDKVTPAPDSKGLRYLSVLLPAPGEDIHVLDLVAAVEGVGDDGLSADRGSSGPALDDAAKREYQQRIAELDRQLDVADRRGDQELARRAEDERAFLVQELAGAVGLRGRDRAARDDAERARSAVGRAIRGAVVRLAGTRPDLHQHLDATVHTGMHCAYRPDPRAARRWQVSGTAQSRHRSSPRP